jgi:hypothetical protein
MSQLSDTFAEVRARLDQIGLQAPVVPLAMRDQIGAAFRADLVSLGIDTGADGALNAAIAGMAVGLKMLIQQGASPPLLGHYVWVCECLVPMIDTPQSDLTGFDMDFLTSLNLKPLETPDLGNYSGGTEPDEVVVRFACSKCGGPDAIVPVQGLHFCIPCASEAVTGGLAALRMANPKNVEFPRVGGPEFNRESVHTEEPVPQVPAHTDAEGDDVDPAEAPMGGTVDTPPPPSWKDMTVADVAGVLLRNLRGCRCRSYHARTGEHAEGCPRRKK